MCFALYLHFFPPPSSKTLSCIPSLLRACPPLVRARGHREPASFPDSSTRAPARPRYSDEGGRSTPRGRVGVRRRPTPPPGHVRDPSPSPPRPRAHLTVHICVPSIPSTRVPSTAPGAPRGLPGLGSGWGEAPRPAWSNDCVVSSFYGPFGSHLCTPH